VEEDVGAVRMPEWIFWRLNQDPGEALIAAFVLAQQPGSGLVEGGDIVHIKNDLECKRHSKLLLIKIQGRAD